MKKEYFLTAQQKDIERQILKSIRIKRGGYYHFSGLPGTGKTLLLYDIAMKLSGRQMVCIIHCRGIRAGMEKASRAFEAYRLGVRFADYGRDAIGRI